MHTCTEKGLRSLPLKNKRFVVNPSLKTKRSFDLSLKTKRSYDLSLKTKRPTTAFPLNIRIVQLVWKCTINMRTELNIHKI